MLINLTPHPVRLYGPEGDEPREEIPPSGEVARVATNDLGTNHDKDGTPYELVEYGYIHNLPEPRSGVVYLVSLVVALAARNRSDLLAPYVEVRNAEGTMIGCRFLQKIA